MRLKVSYSSRFYMEAEDVESPEHPDRRIEAIVGQRCSDAGIMVVGECADRDLGFEPWQGDFDAITADLAKLGFRITLSLFERDDQRLLVPLRTTNVLPATEDEEK